MTDPQETRPQEPRDPLGIEGGPGRIFAADVRLALCSTDALGKLRHELYEALGPNLAHEILFRFGFHDGARTAVAVRRSYQPPRASHSSTWSRRSLPQKGSPSTTR